MPKTKNIVTLICIALCLILVSCIGASLLQTSFGDVEVMTFRIPTDDGTWVTANLYRPKTATAETPAPLVVANHGGANSKEMQDIYAIELSRRGIVVISLDHYFHGDSSTVGVTMTETMTTPTMAMIPIVEYAWNLNYVDKDNIGVTGHSLGGGSTWTTMQYYGQKYKAALAEAVASDSDGGTAITPAEQEKIKEADKITAGLPMGSAVLFCNEEVLSDIHANVGVIEGQFDENGYVRPQETAIYQDGDSEVMTLVNSGLAEGERVDNAKVGTYYGTPADKSLRVFYNPKEIHAWNHFSKTSASYAVEFFTQAFQMENPIPATNQIWFTKEVFNLAGLVGVFLLIVPFAMLLLKVPCFAGLVQPEPPRLPAPKTKKARMVFFGTWMISILVSWLSFVPMSGMDYIFGASYGLDNSSVIFPQPITNFILAWGIFNGLTGLLLFFLSYHFFGKKNGTTPEMWGLRISFKQLLQTFALAVCVFGGIYVLVFLADYFFKVDFRFWLLAVKPFSAEKLMIGIRYMVMFFVFYLSGSLAVNAANRIEGQKEWKNLIYCGLGNVLGLIIIEGIQYITLFTTGKCHYTGNLTFNPLFVLNLIPLLFGSAWVSRYLFKATGKVWLGAMLNCGFIVMIGVANTFTRLPLN